MALLVALCRPGAARGAQAPWVATEQPNLGEEVRRAGPLKVENVCQPVTTVRVERTPILVPNPDGRTYDAVQLFYRNDGGPAALCGADLGTGETFRHDIPQGRNVHLQGMQVGSDGRLYMGLQSREGLELWVYEPGPNRLTSRGGINADYFGQTNQMTVGTNGLIYGTVGHRPSRKAGI